MIITALTIRIKSIDDIPNLINDIESCGGKLKALYKEKSDVDNLKYTVQIQHDSIFFSYFINTYTFKNQ